MITLGVLSPFLSRSFADSRSSACQPTDMHASIRRLLLLLHAHCIRILYAVLYLSYDCTVRLRARFPAFDVSVSRLACEQTPPMEADDLADFKKLNEASAITGLISRFLGPCGIACSTTVPTLVH